MTGYLNVMAVIQKFFDQSISTNTSYNPQNYEGKEVPASVLLEGPPQVLPTRVSKPSTTTTPMTARVRKRSNRTTEEKAELSVEDLLEGMTKVDEQAALTKHE